MTKVLIDVALVAIASLAGGSIMSSGRQFMVLFTRLRADMAAGMPKQTMLVTTCSTSVETALGPVTAMACQPDFNIARNAADLLSVRSRMRRRPAAMRAAA